MQFHQSLTQRAQPEDDQQVEHVRIARGELRAQLVVDQFGQQRLGLRRLEHGKSRIDRRFNGVCAQSEAQNAWIVLTRAPSSDRKSASQ